MADKNIKINLENNIKYYLKKYNDTYFMNFLSCIFVCLNKKNIFHMLEFKYKIFNFFIFKKIYLYIVGYSLFLYINKKTIYICLDNSLEDNEIIFYTEKDYILNENDLIIKQIIE